MDESRPSLRTDPTDRRSFLRLATGILAGGSTLLAQVACGDDGSTGLQLGGDPDTSSPDDGGSGFCSISEDEIFLGAARDAIPALSDPNMSKAESSDFGFLEPNDRVVGLLGGSVALAVPLNILWWHEIVNVWFEGRRIAVTHCPLTGSSLVFETGAADADFGVSGLLYRNNLIMYDRGTGESLWPQMLRRAACGPLRGTNVDMVGAVEMSWDRWRTLYPGSEVVTSDTGFSRSYRIYPYVAYDAEDNEQLLFPLPDEIDRRRPPKERVLGIADRAPTVAFPFGWLRDLGTVAAVNDAHRVVLWDEAGQAAMAYQRDLDGQTLGFEVAGGHVVDRETGSTWRVDGLAVAGPLEGRRLTPIAEAYVAYWFAWAAFHPDTFVRGEE
jgi:hypothetical protein